MPKMVIEVPEDIRKWETVMAEHLAALQRTVSSSSPANEREIRLGGGFESLGLRRQLVSRPVTMST